MKEIQGKIKFGIIPLKKEETNTFTSLDDELFDNLTNEQMDNSYMLSEITEEQAAKFVEYYKTEGVYRNYIGSLDEAWDCATAQESLISLLKANDVWIKEWLHDEYDMESYRQKLLTLPDNLLLIKL